MTAIGSAVRVRVAGVDYAATMSTQEVSALFDCSAELLQRQAGKGQLPVEPLRLGNRLRWPTLLVAAAVGLPAVAVAGESSGSGS